MRSLLNKNLLVACVLGLMAGGCLAADAVPVEPLVGNEPPIMEQIASSRITAELGVKEWRLHDKSARTGQSDLLIAGHDGNGDIILGVAYSFEMLGDVAIVRTSDPLRPDRMRVQQIRADGSVITVEDTLPERFLEALSMMEEDLGGSWNNSGTTNFLSPCQTATLELFAACGGAIGSFIATIAATGGTAGSAAPVLVGGYLVAMAATAWCGVEVDQWCDDCNHICGSSSSPQCGNEVCEEGEDASSCSADCGSGTGGGVLKKGAAKTDLSGSADSIAYYSIGVPEGVTNLSFQLYGGTGDGDLYVKFGSMPTTTSFDCRSWSGTNEELCQFPSTQAGIYYVMVRGYNNYSGASLLADYNYNACDGYSRAPETFSGGSDSKNRAYVDVPACATQLTISLSGGTGEADLYVKYGSAPEIWLYDCEKYAGNVVTCQFSPPSEGRYHIMLYGYSSYSNVTLTADVR